MGVPQPGLQFRLESIPEMKYDALDKERPRGEVCMKGPAISPGQVPARTCLAEFAKSSFCAIKEATQGSSQ